MQQLKNKNYSKKIKRYLNNANLKAENQRMEFTDEQVAEYLKCKNDVIHFIRTHVKIRNLDNDIINFDLYDFQEELLNIIHSNRFTIVKFPRQVGKSTTIVAYLLWVILFHPFNEIAILANKGDSARGILNRLRMAYEYIPLWMQQGVLQWNKGFIELENKSSIVAASTNSSAGRSGSYNIVMLDEFAFIPSNIAHDFFKSVFPTVSSGMNSKVIIVSTPNGMNLFHRKWIDSKKGRSGFVPYEAHWWDVPWRDEEWKENEIKELGEEGFQQEHGGEFLGATNTLIAASKLKSLSPLFEDPKWSNGGFEMYEAPTEKGIYILIVDPSEGQGLDYSAFTVIDVTEMPYKVVAKYRSSTISPLIFPSVIAGAGEKYNQAHILVEVNLIGGEIANILHYELEYENIFKTTNAGGRGGQQVSSGHTNKSKYGVKTTASVKSIGCSTLKSLIEMDQLFISDFDILSELTTFIAKGKSFQAEPGCNDDLVMTLVLFSWLSNQSYFKDLTDSNIRLRLMKEEKRKEEEEMLPFGFIVNAAESEVTIDKDGTVWHDAPDWATEEQIVARDFWNIFKNNDEF